MKIHIPNFLIKEAGVCLNFFQKMRLKLITKILSYKAYFNGEDNFRFHEIVNLKKYGTL